MNGDLNWHELEASAVLEHLGVDPHLGLSSKEAAARLAKYGPNELGTVSGHSPWVILVSQFKSIMVVILVVAAIASVLLGDVQDAVAILVIVVLNVGLGFRQEYRAERAMEALRKLAVPLVRVVRDGAVKEIPAAHLVPGDITVLEAGNVVPADSRLTESILLRAQESALTGESEAVEKQRAALPPANNLPLGDRTNMVYMGTVISYGRGRGVVIATGMNTELGEIASMLRQVKDERTPLQRRLDQLGKVLALAALALVIIIFVSGLARGESFETMFLTAVSMAVAAVPEGLPAVVTIALSLGAQRMLKRRALIRRLPAVETLGSVTVICSDKTGTLTANRMTVTGLAGPHLHVDYSEECVIGLEAGKPASMLEALTLAAATLCNDASLPQGDAPLAQRCSQVVGDPTESSLVVAAARRGLEKERLQQWLPRVSEWPFDSDRKRMSTVHCLAPEVPGAGRKAEATKAGRLPEAERMVMEALGLNPGEAVCFTKGAPDSILLVCRSIWTDEGIRPLDEAVGREIAQINGRMAAGGMRVLGVAMKPLGSVCEEEMDAAANGLQLESELVFLGLAGMIDPPRPEAAAAVATCLAAGIRPVMITGDHQLTAQAIAKEIGIPSEGPAVTGSELESMPMEDLEKAARGTGVYARVSPEHKLRIVQALQNLGHIVSMTGDGVNDAPALRKADIGVAMGITGTDVSKEAADMVLLDDNFATIVASVEQGRVIYDNIRKFLRYILNGNVGELAVMLIGPLIGMPLPLLPLQILWINLVTDGLPALALGVEPPDRNVMRRPPLPPGQSVLTRSLGTRTVVGGLLLGLVSLAVGWVYRRSGNEDWQTILFTTLTVSQMGVALAVRSEELLFSRGLMTNKTLLGAVALTFALQLAVVFVPFLQSVFSTRPLSLGEIGAVMLASIVVFLAMEIEKVITIGLRKRRTA